MGTGKAFPNSKGVPTQRSHGNNWGIADLGRGLGPFPMPEEKMPK
jgi:hypothetical protein